MRRAGWALPLAALAATPVAAARTEATSWGKPDVSIDQYRTDAITCGRAGYYADVSGTEAAHVFKRATSELEANEAGLPGASPDDRLSCVLTSGQIVQSTRPEERMKDVGQLMQARVDDCLRGRGYIHFRLTRDQRRRLEHLHLGSAERHLYLYRLATDPDVLKQQGM
jgi:hypothetical protein